MAKYKNVKRNGRWVTVNEQGKEVNPGQGALRDIARAVKKVASDAGDQVVYSDKTDAKGNPLTIGQVKQIEGKNYGRPKPKAPALPSPKVAEKMKQGETFKNNKVQPKVEDTKPAPQAEAPAPQRRASTAVVRNPAPQAKPSTPSKPVESGYKAGDKYYRGSDTYKKALADKNGGSSSGNPLLDKMRREMGLDAATGEKSSGPSMDKQKATAAGIIASGKVEALKPTEGSKNFSKDSGVKPTAQSKDANYSESFKKKEDEKKKALMIKGYKK
jgi:hypothetical protein